MGYITFFQFLRRCLLWDAEGHTTQQAAVKDAGGMPDEPGRKGLDGADRPEQAGRPGGGGTVFGGCAHSDRNRGVQSVRLPAGVYPWGLLRREKY